MASPAYRVCHPISLSFCATEGLQRFSTSCSFLITLHRPEVTSSPKTLRPGSKKVQKRQQSRRVPHLGQSTGRFRTLTAPLGRGKRTSGISIRQKGQRSELGLATPVISRDWVRSLAFSSGVSSSRSWSFQKNTGKWSAATHPYPRLWKRDAFLCREKRTKRISAERKTPSQRRATQTAYGGGRKALLPTQAAKNPRCTRKLIWDDSREFSGEVLR